LHLINSQKMPSGVSFETEVSRSLKLVSMFAEGLYYKKLFDTSAYRSRLICPRCGAKVTSPFIAATTISDHVVFLPNGTVVFLEEKLFRTPEFPLSRISQDQLLWAYRIYSRRKPDHILYFFLINNRRVPRHYRTWALSYSHLEKAVAVEGRLSLKPVTLAEVGIELPRLSNMFWDMFDLLGFSHIPTEERNEAAKDFDATLLPDPKNQAKDVWKILREIAKNSRKRSKTEVIKI